MSLFKKRTWNNPELQKKCQLYDRLSMLSMLFIILSVWLLPNYTNKANIIAELFVVISVILIGVSWYTEKQDKKYIPPTNEETTDENSEPKG
jgi:uncharacterized membrane protein